MDGERTSEELVGLLGGAGRPDAASVVAGLLGRLGPLLVDGTPRESSHELESLARVLPVDPDEGLRRLPGPRILHWWVTSYCPKRCVYCFANPTLGGRAEDAVLTRPELRKVFVEAASLGAVRLLVAGAEPLLRPDLPDVLGDAVAAGLLPLITTKHRIDRALAQRFAAAGLRHMSLSLDTVEPAESKKLVGLANYPEQVRSSIACLKQAGMEFSLQTVLTRFNPEALLPVVQFASAQGARVVQVIPYEPVREPIGPYGNEELAAVCSRDAIRQELERLGGMFRGVKLELFEELDVGA
jgi:molybdenum cofactor biosynthesis enzyme MoaA